MAADYRVVLIVDQDDAFLKSFEGESANGVRAITCANYEKAQTVVANADLAIVSVFVSAALDPVKTLKFVGLLHRSRTGLKIVIYGPKPLRISEDDLDRLGVTRTREIPEDIAKIVTIAQLEKTTEETKTKMSSVSGTSKPQSSLAPASDTPAGDAENILDSEFTPIRADNFISSAKAIFDLYIRLSPNKYVLILRKGETFIQKNLNRYISEGVTHFFMKTDVQESYLKFCETLTQKLLKSTKVSADVKVSQTLNLGEECLNYLERCGISQRSLDYASGYVDTVDTLFQHFNPASSSSVLRKFIEDIAGYRHGVSTAMIASLITKQLQMDSHQETHVVGIGALLHDIGLVGMPDVILSEDESKMNAEQARLFREHPKKGALLAASVQNIAPAVPQAIAQHHVRKGNQGFPVDMQASARTLVAEVIGISDEFSRLAEKASHDPTFDPLKYMQVEVFPGFSARVSEAFALAFISQTPWEE